MTHTTLRSTLLLATAALVVTGCFKLSRESPPVERYVLGGAVDAPDGSLQQDSAGLSIGLRRLDLAPYLASLAIVVRRADHEIITTGFHRWAESPNAGVNRAVSGYLALSPGIRAVDVAPWPVRADHDYIVQLHVSRFEGVAPGGAASRQGEAHILARWEIIRPNDGSLVARGATDYRSPNWPVNDYADLVTRLDRGLVMLTKELVTCLTRLGPAAPVDSVVAGVAAPTMECAAR